MIFAVPFKVVYWVYWNLQKWIFIMPWKWGVLSVPDSLAMIFAVPWKWPSWPWFYMGLKCTTPSHWRMLGPKKGKWIDNVWSNNPNSKNIHLPLKPLKFIYYNLTVNVGSRLEKIHISWIPKANKNLDSRFINFNSQPFLISSQY